MKEEKTENKEDLKNEGIESTEHEDAEKLASDENQKENEEKQLSPENEILELKFEQLQEGIQTPVPYKTREIKLLQPFGNDFEDF